MKYNRVIQWCVAAVLSLTASLGDAAEPAKRMRIDVDGRGAGIALTAGKTEGKAGMAITSGTWLPANVQNQVLVCQAFSRSEEWQKITFSFTPIADGVVKLVLRSEFKQAEGEKVPVWMFVDNITIKSTLLTAYSFERSKAELKERGWYFADGAAIVKDNAHKGKHALRVWHDGLAILPLTVKQGKPVHISAWFKPDSSTR